MEGQRSWLCDPTFHSYHAQCSFTERFLLHYQRFSREERYIRLAREVIHDYINVTFSHILFPFCDNFLLVSLIMDIASSILATIPTDSQSQIRSTLNVRPSNKTTKCVRAKKVSWNYDETIALINVMGTENIQRKMEGMMVYNHKIWKYVADQLYSRTMPRQVGILMKFKRSSTNVISSDVAILEGRTSCLPDPHPRLLQADLVTHSARAKWYHQSKGPWFGRSKCFTRPIVAMLTSLWYFGGGLDLC